MNKRQKKKAKLRLLNKLIKKTKRMSQAEFNKIDNKTKYTFSGVDLGKTVLKIDTSKLEKLKECVSAVYIPFGFSALPAIRGAIKSAAALEAILIQNKLKFKPTGIL